MKFIIFILGILFIAGCTHVSTTSSPVTSPINIDGRWVGSVFPLEGSTCVYVSYEFKKDGDKLTGTGSADADYGRTIYEKIPIKNGKIDGNIFYFYIKFRDKQRRDVVIDKYVGKYLGDTLQLTIRSKVGGGWYSQPNRFTVKRAE